MFRAFSNYEYSWLRSVLPNLELKTSKRLPEKTARSLALLLSAPSHDVYVRLGGSVFMQKRARYRVSQWFHDAFYRAYACVLVMSYGNVFVIGANYGPAVTKRYDRANRMIFEHSVDVCFRDERSADLFYDVSSVRFASDLVFTFDPPSIDKSNTAFVSLVDLNNQAKFWFDEDVRARYESDILGCCVSLARRGLRPVLSGFCEHEGDFNAVQRISDELAREGIDHEVLNYRGNLKEVLDAVGAASVLVGTRFHAIVLGLLCDCAVVPVVYSEKTTAMLDGIGYPQDCRYLLGKRPICLERALELQMSKGAFDIAAARNNAFLQFKGFDRFVLGETD